MNQQRRSELAVCGLEAVRALAAAMPETVTRFFCSAEHIKEFGGLCSLLARERRPYRVVEAAELERLSGTVHHQGVVAMVADLPPARVTDSLVRQWAAGGSRVVLLDGVGDDHNIGAIARAAAFFGWSALVLTERFGPARLTTSAYRVARGALSRVQVYADESAARCLARAAGALPSVGADHRGSTELSAFRPAGGGLILALGNEESGLDKETQAACGSLVRIQGAGAMESLNVSQAAALFLHHCRPPVAKA
ncbi:MAG: RNA methyltransferase [Spirochaetia bacterium]|nr:RNA methyltransferase [Spirochaetia bacterium]